MAMTALKLESETPVEERTGKLETHIEHMRADIADLKVDVRRLGDKIDEVDERLVGKIDEVDKRLGGKIDEVNERLVGKIGEVDKRLGGKIDEVNERLVEKINEVEKTQSGKSDSLKAAMDKGFSAIDKRFAKMKIARVWDRVWFLLIAGAIFGVLARGFQWI